MINANDYGTVTISPNVGGTPPTDTRSEIQKLLDSFEKTYAAKKTEHANVMNLAYAIQADMELLASTMEGLKRALSLGEDKAEESPRMAAYR